MGIDNSTRLPRYITTLIQVTVRKAVDWYGFPESDQDDLEQQIVLEVVRRRAKYDPDRAKENTFLARLVKHAIADIIAARKAGIRNYRREEGSLDQWVQDESGEWALRGEAITGEEAGRRVGRSSVPQQEQHDLRIDLGDAVASLPAALREIFEQYAAMGPARKVAAATDRHHSSVCEAIQQIKQHFAKAGLEVYLPKPQCPDPTDSDGRR